MEGCGGFRPNDEFGFSLRRLQGEFFVNFHRRLLIKLIPFEMLFDISLGDCYMDFRGRFYLGPCEVKSPVSPTHPAPDYQSSGPPTTRNEKFPGIVFAEIKNPGIL